jgi:hypothetical protein
MPMNKNSSGNLCAKPMSTTKQTQFDRRCRRSCHRPSWSGRARRGAKAVGRRARTSASSRHESQPIYGGDSVVSARPPVFLLVTCLPFKNLPRCGGLRLPSRPALLTNRLAQVLSFPNIHSFNKLDVLDTNSATSDTMCDAGQGPGTRNVSHSPLPRTIPGRASKNN